jgi:hypothetical protein
MTTLVPEAAARAGRTFNLPLEGRSKFEASSRSEDAREFREGGAESRCRAPLPKLALAKLGNLRPPLQGEVGNSADRTRIGSKESES